VTPDTVALMQRYDWSRNNVRELRNTVERLVIATQEDLIQPAHLPAEISQVDSADPGEQGAGRASPGKRPGSPLAAPGTLKDLKAAAERQIILAALERNDWHITRTAAELGLADHSSLLKIMRRQKIKRR